VRLAGTVLVVDDEAGVRDAIARMLERMGLSVIAADGGRAGLAALAHHRGAVSAVVLDLTMPDIGGLEVLREIRASAPRTPVVVVSGYTRSDAIEELGREGPQAFLQKPFTPQDLAETLQSLLAAGGAVSARGSGSPPA
jgi:CheY-like chemotaxis protein